MTSISSNFLLISVLSLSSLTLNAEELNSVSICEPYRIPVVLSSDNITIENYSIKWDCNSNKTPHLERSLRDEYNILSSFANKILSEESPIDPEIQNIIDEHFWDML